MIKPRQHFAVQRWGGGSNAVDDRLRLVEGQSGAVAIGQHAAGFGQNQAGGRDIPFGDAAPFHPGVGLVSRQHRHAQRQAIGLGHGGAGPGGWPEGRVQIGLIDRQAHTLQRGETGYGEALAVQGRAAPDAGGIEPILRRRVEHGGNHGASFDQRHRYGPARPPAQEIAGAVDGIDHPHPAAFQPGRAVSAFFRQPAIIWAGSCDHALQIIIHRHVGGTHRAAIFLVPPGRRFAEMRHGDAPGIGSDLGRQRQISVARRRAVRGQLPATIMPSMRSVGALLA